MHMLFSMKQLKINPEIRPINLLNTKLWFSKGAFDKPYNFWIVPFK